MSIRTRLIASAAVVLLVVSACSSTITITASSPSGAELAAPTALPTVAPVSEGAQSAEPSAPTPTVTTRSTAAATTTPIAEPAPTMPPTPAPAVAEATDGVVTGVIDIPVQGVLGTELDRSAFLSPRMQERLDQLLRPDSLVEPRPEHATLIGGLRKAQGDALGAEPWILDSDVRFFTLAHEVDATASLEIITPSYHEFAQIVNGVEVSVGPRNGGPNWIIEPVGQTPGERRQRKGQPHLVDIDTILRSGGVYDIERLLLTKFRFAHRRGVIGSPPMVADTMPEWVQFEVAALEPVIQATGMRITDWEAAVAPDWLSGEPAEAQGFSTVRITLGTAGNSVNGEPGDGVSLALKQLGETIGVQGGFTDVKFSSETETSGSYTYEDGDRSLRYYHSAGPTVGESFITFTIDESNTLGF